jgi:hypothetical protein
LPEVKEEPCVIKEGAITALEALQEGGHTSSLLTEEAYQKSVQAGWERYLFGRHASAVALDEDPHPHPTFPLFDHPLIMEGSIASLRG